MFSVPWITFTWRLDGVSKAASLTLVIIQEEKPGFGDRPDSTSTSSWFLNLPRNW